MSGPNGAACSEAVLARRGVPVRGWPGRIAKRNLGCMRGTIEGATLVRGGAGG